MVHTFAHSDGSCLFGMAGMQMFLFCNIVQSLFASFVRIYKIKLSLVRLRLPLKFSLNINLPFAVATVLSYGNMAVAPSLRISLKLLMGRFRESSPTEEVQNDDLVETVHS